MKNTVISLELSKLKDDTLVAIYQLLDDRVGISNESGRKEEFWHLAEEGLKMREYLLVKGVIK